MPVCFVSTNHLPDRLWFRDDDDFRAGMNLVAILAYSLGIPVLAFILMSNHVHFVLACNESDALRFITEFKRRYSQYFQRKYGSPSLLARNENDIRNVGLATESLERIIAYVQMNCVAANICSHPTQYRWGTGSCFFSSNIPDGLPLGEMSKRRQARLLHSEENLPATFRMLSAGYIDPGSYVQSQIVEKLFRTPERYNYFLYSSSKAKTKLERNPLPSFRDQTILRSIPDLCQSLFKTDCVEKLEDAQMTELLRQLRFRFSADIAQLARVLSLSTEEVVGLLDNV
ncbi:MAG: transposase [Bacteroidales bacterium]|nr:transposase [Bacteroidales bacterium]